MKQLIFSLVLFAAPCCDAAAQDTTRLSLLFLGDIMQHDSQIADAYDPVAGRYDYEPCFRYVKPYTQAVDLAIGNLELTLGGPPYRGYPRFSAPDELAVALRDIGMDVLVTANNHCVDRGRDGLERTIHMLDSFNILHTGTFADEVSRLNEHPLLIEKHGFELALLNYTYGTNGLPVTAPNIVNLIDTAVIREDLGRARSWNGDLIVVFLHWGAEYQSLPSKSQKELAEFCFTHGAHMVIGAHPHVLQPMEWRKDRNQLVVYSMGNFVSGQRTRGRDGGAMVTVGLEKIRFGSDSSSTRIDSAAYILEWVYRTADSAKNYYVLPVPSFEGADADFIRGTGPKEAFETFIADSRGLLGKHNVNMRESVFIPSDSLVTYRVRFLTISEADSSRTAYPAVPYDVEIASDGNRKIFYSGNFLNRRDAGRYAARLVVEFGYRDAVVVEFVNGMQIR